MSFAWERRLALPIVVALGAVGCKTSSVSVTSPSTSLSASDLVAPPTSGHASAETTRAPEPPARVETLLSHRPDLVLTVHPPTIARDAVYGPLLRRASELASAFAGPTNLGTTALAVLERTDEVVIAETDRGKEAVVVLRGVPASLDALDVVDTSGHPIWQPVHGDLRASSRELAPAGAAAGAEDAALFVLPGLVWIIASGPAVPRVRAAMANGVARGSFAGDDTSLASLSLPADALPQLRQGSLATVGAGLLHVGVEHTPGATGLVITKLTYIDTVAAASAEGTVLAVTLAFRHRLEEAVEASDRKAGPPRPPRPASNLEWLGAAKVEREGTTVLLRAPIPRRWLDALSHAQVMAPL